MPAEIFGIAIHRTEIGKTPEEVIEREGEHGLGYHYFVDLEGDVHRLAPDSHLKWHARSWSRGFLGGAVYGYFAGDVPTAVHTHPTARQTLALTNLCCALWHRYGPLPIVGHSDLPNGSFEPGKRCPGPLLDVQAISREVTIQYGLARLARLTVVSLDPEVSVAEGLC